MPDWESLRLRTTDKGDLDASREGMLATRRRTNNHGSVRVKARTALVVAILPIVAASIECAPLVVFSVALGGKDPEPKDHRRAVQPTRVRRRE